MVQYSEQYFPIAYWLKGRESVEGSPFTPEAAKKLYQTGNRRYSNILTASLTAAGCIYDGVSTYIPESGLTIDQFHHLTEQGLVVVAAQFAREKGASAKAEQLGKRIGMRQYIETERRNVEDDLFRIAWTAGNLVVGTHYEIENAALVHGGQIFVAENDHHIPQSIMEMAATIETSAK